MNGAIDGECFGERCCERACILLEFVYVCMSPEVDFPVIHTADTTDGKVHTIRESPSFIPAAHVMKDNLDKWISVINRYGGQGISHL